MNDAARQFERCSKQSRRLGTRAIFANSQADFHQHVITQLYAALAPTIKETELHLEWFDVFQVECGINRRDIASSGDPCLTGNVR